MKKLLITLLALLPAVAAMAQEHCVAFTPALFKQADNLTEKSMATLKLKIEQIITRSGAAKTALYGAFVIYPELNITEKRTTNAGTSTVTVADAELTLFAINSIDNSMYGSVTVAIQGSGRNEEAAMSAMFQQIKPTNPAFVKFIKNATDQIIKYYSDNMPTVIRKAETLMAAEKYEDALMFLESIPICVPSYEQSSDAIQAIYKVISDKSCHALITMAERAYELGDMEAAKEMVMNIKPGSKCEDQVKVLLIKINDPQKTTKSKASTEE